MGLAAARAFAASGAAVGLADIDDNAVNQAAKELTDAGHQALALVCDVTDEDQVAAAVDRTVATFGRLDMTYNNAGIMVPPTDTKKALAEIWNAEDSVHALAAVGALEAAYGARFGKVIGDLDELPAFYDFPAGHWIHLRTTNPIQSTFATV